MLYLYYFIIDRLKVYSETGEPSTSYWSKVPDISNLKAIETKPKKKPYKKLKRAKTTRAPNSKALD